MARDSVRSAGAVVHERAQRLEPHQLVPKAGEARIEAARVRHDEHPTLSDRLGLGARAAARLQAEVRLIDGEPDERYHPRSHSPDLAREDRAPPLDLLG